jgi:hypothetical protein
MYSSGAMMTMVCRHPVQDIHIHTCLHDPAETKIRSRSRTPPQLQTRQQGEHKGITQGQHSANLESMAIHGEQGSREIT